MTKDGSKELTRSQFGGNVLLEKHFGDRNRASTPREKEVFPEWTMEDYLERRRAERGPKVLVHIISSILGH